MRLNIISIDLSVLSCEGNQGRLFASVLPQGGFFYNIRLKSPKFCFIATVITAGKCTLREKMIKPIFDYLINPSALSSHINAGMFLDSDSTTVFANEIRPLNFTIHRLWLLQIRADWKLPISDQAIGHPTPEQSGLSECLCKWSWVQVGGSWKSVLFPQLQGDENFIWSFQSCKATHSTPGCIIFLACSTILERLVIKDKNSRGFFKHKNYKKSGPFFDPLPFRLHAAFYSHLDTLVIVIILVFFLVLLFFKDCSLVKCFLKKQLNKGHPKCPVHSIKWLFMPFLLICTFHPEKPSYKSVLHPAEISMCFGTQFPSSPSLYIPVLI